MRLARPLVVLVSALALLPAVPGSALAAGGPQTVTLYLAPHDRAALQDLAHATGVSPEERRARLAALRPDAEDRRQVAKAAGRLGLTVTSQQGARVQVRAASGLVRQLFGSAREVAPTSRFKHPLPQLPASLRGAVTVAYGGDDARLSAVPLDWEAGSTPGNPGLNGTQLRAAYDTTAPTANTAGATVATIQLSDWNDQNLRAYATAAGLTLGADQFQRINVDNGPQGDTWADVEVALDQESLLGVAPLARQRAYFAPRSSSSTDPYLDAIYAVGDDAASPALGNKLVALSTSYGFCEDPTQADAFQAYEDALAYVLGAGVTVFAASGDNGSFCQSSTLLPSTTTYPASSPSVVAVGGTSVASTDPVVETAWACGAASGCSSSQAAADCQSNGCAGGGTSALFGRPTWQAKATSSTRRQVPDIAAVADPQTGLGVFVAPVGVTDPTTGCSGPCTGVVGGTSLAAPVSAALLANELMRAGRAGGVGDVHGALYASASTAMRDIDDGGSNGAGPAGAGYDLVTGLGVPQWDHLAPALLRAPGDVAGVVNTAHAPYAWRSSGYTSLGGTIVTPLSTFSRNGVDFFSGVGSNKLPYLRSTTRGWARLTASGACTDTQVALSGIVLLAGCRGTDGAAYVSGATLSDAGTATLDPWKKVGGAFVGAPAMAYVQGTLTLIGTGTNGYAYQSRYVGGAWTSFAKLPLTCASRPGLAVSGSLAVLACVASDRTVHYLRRTSSTWPAQASAGGAAAGAVGVSLTPDGRTTLYVTGTNRVLYSRTVAPALSSWTSRGGSSWAFGAGATPTTSVTPAARTKPTATTTSLAASPNPSTGGQTVTLTATVGHPGAVAFRDLSTSDTVAVASVAANGTATATTSTLGLGQHGLVAIYSGSPSYAASASPVVLQTVTASPTTTTLTASDAAPTYDSPVTLTATVSSASGTPTGAVDLVDQANGTVLSTVTLSGGSASFTTRSLAVGARSLVATYRPSGAFGASSSAAKAVTVAAPASSVATTYQMTTRHDGADTTAAPAPSTLVKKWTFAPGKGQVSYALSAGGRVFVDVASTSSYGTTAYALDAATGAVQWSAGLAGTYYFGALAYDGGRVFALNFDGQLTALDAATGALAWSVDLPGQYSFTSPPTAYDGLVYVGGAGSGGTLYAVNEVTGAVQWTGSVANGDHSAPAVDDSGAYVSYACEVSYRFSAAGSKLWTYPGSCSGGGGRTPVLHGSTLYVRDDAGAAPTRLSTANGAALGTFTAGPAPAVDASQLYALAAGTLQGRDLTGTTAAWSFTGDGKLVTAPVVWDGHVFVGSSTGSVYAVSAATGAQEWVGDAGAPVTGPDEHNAYNLAGLTVAGGQLLVPAGTTLVAFA